MMFDKQVFKVSVHGNFDEYRRYKESQKISDKMAKLIVLFVGVAGGGIIMAFGVHTMFYQPPVPSTFWADFTSLGITVTGLSWSGYAKFMLFLLSPVIAISWLFHGVQARLLA